jgi:hypothetical protein
MEFHDPSLSQPGGAHREAPGSGSVHDQALEIFFRHRVNSPRSPKLASQCKTNREQVTPAPSPTRAHPQVL